MMGDSATHIGKFIFNKLFHFRAQGRGLEGYCMRGWISGHLRNISSQVVPEIDILTCLSCVRAFVRLLSNTVTC
jgi:hypothetical protein